MKVVNIFLIFFFLPFSLCAMEAQNEVALAANPKEKLDLFEKYVSAAGPFDDNKTEVKLLYIRCNGINVPLMPKPVLTAYVEKYFSKKDKNSTKNSTKKADPIEVDVGNKFWAKSTERGRKYTLGLLNCIKSSAEWNLRGTLKDLNMQKLRVFILEQPHIKLRLYDKMIREKLLQITGIKKEQDVQQDTITDSARGDSDRFFQKTGMMILIGNLLDKAEISGDTSVKRSVITGKGERWKSSATIETPISYALCDVTAIENIAAQKSADTDTHYAQQILQCSDQMENANYPGRSVYSKKELENIQNIQHPEFSDYMHEYIDSRNQLLKWFSEEPSNSTLDLKQEGSMRRQLRELVLDMQDEKEEFKHLNEEELFSKSLADLEKNSGVKLLYHGKDFYDKRRIELQGKINDGNQPEEKILEQFFKERNAKIQAIFQSKQSMENISKTWHGYIWMKIKGLFRWY